LAGGEVFLVRAVLGLGRGLRLPVLAEGVETHAELVFLQRELCDEAQGYFLGRPSEIDSFRHLTHGSAKTARLSARSLNSCRVRGPSDWPSPYWLFDLSYG
jgi:predicted signal transduction protein with EAL and GGDEF domain